MIENTYTTFNTYRISAFRLFVFVRETKISSSLVESLRVH